MAENSIYDDIQIFRKERIAELEGQITQLKADLAELRLPIKSAIHYEELTETDYEILVVDYFKVKSDLDKFGGHTAECDIHNPTSERGCFGINVFDVERKCDCGYAEAKERRLK